MKKIDYTIKFYRNCLAQGMVPREAFMLCAVASLTNNETPECTSHQVAELTGDTHPSVTLRRMTWWLNIRECRNVRNKKAFYYSVNQKGLEKIDCLLN